MVSRASISLLLALLSFPAHAGNSLSCQKEPEGVLRCGNQVLACSRPPQPSSSCLGGGSFDNSLGGLEWTVDRGESWRQFYPFASRMKKQSSIKYLTVHYTGEPRRPVSIEQKLQVLFRFSAYYYSCTEPRKIALWGDVPYNFYVDVHGNVAKGRDVNCQDDTNTAYDPAGHLSVVVEATLNDRIPDDQTGRLYGTLRALQLKYGIPLSRVGVHHDFGETQCPGPEITRLVRTYVQMTKQGCLQNKLRGAICN
ncbi:MAG TPA: N-acetylmuramoyl-L-alanine amidase [Bdellovibrionota bacterium]|jgi:hypothetical protein